MSLHRKPACGWICHLSFLVLLAALCLCAASATPIQAATPEQVDQAIEKAKKFLYSQMNAKGTWEEVEKPVRHGENADVKGRQWGGLTAIATYALLASGESPQSQKLAKPIDFLKNAPILGTYALGLRCQVWPFLGDDKTARPLMDRDRDILLRAMHQDLKDRNANSFGFYSYAYDRGPYPKEWYDHSVSQYGVLGMWALEQAGAEVPVKYWQVVDAAWRRAQYSDGGWSYRQKGPDASSPDFGRETPSMAAAGIATLFITQEYLTTDAVACNGNVTNENIDRGLKWMASHFKEVGDNTYAWYGVERIGVASGRKYFNTIDWYQAGADHLVKAQKPDGSWDGHFTGGAPIPSTAFAMLFLTRGRAPVMMNKLEYELSERGKTMDGNWNQRPRDVANFARWMGRQLERDLNWQAVNLKVSADELHDAPILYISGDQMLKFSDEAIEKLRTFVEQGGMILGSADCGSRAFSNSFEKLGATLFPAYKFREIEPTHPIFTAEQYPARGRTHPRLMGLTNGVRELMLLVPDADLGRAWQTRSEKTREDVYHLAANVFLYAVDKKNLQYKGETYIVKEDPSVKPARKIALRRLEVGENWNPEPGGWKRLTAILHNNPYKTNLEVKPAKLESGGLAGAQVAHLTGTSAFKLTDDQRKTLKDFVDHGGTLIVDCAGGSAEFADSAETELKAIFGDAATKGLQQPLPPESPVYNLPEAKVDQVRYRTFAKSVLGNTKVPRIKAILVKDRPAVFYSREDLSGGLVGEPVDGVLGYEPASATAIMRNLVLFAASGPKPPVATAEKGKK